MSDYLNSRDDQALEQLIKRSEAAEKLTAQQQENLDAARRILAERSAANVATHFDIPRAISFLTSVAKEGRLCSYKELAIACVSDPDADWSSKIGAPEQEEQDVRYHWTCRGLMPLL